MSERIQPKENREFTASIGNWTGPISWLAGPISDKYGMGKINIPADETEAQAELAYPYIKPVPGTLFDFDVYAAVLSGGVGMMGFHAILTDGNYSFETFWLSILGDESWIYTGFSELIPDDWNIPQSKLIIQTNKDPGTEGNLVIDDVTLWAYEVAKIQYLPVMGIG
jgi:hypothetical protein